MLRQDHGERAEELAQGGDPAALLNGDLVAREQGKLGECRCRVLLRFRGAVDFASVKQRDERCDAARSGDAVTNDVATM